ncbi:MAG: hypothetical protein M3O80_03415, partial [Chloroflexota bacterium]|nr:hypothetical protein [Chloroflexota bacterium]
MTPTPRVTGIGGVFFKARDRAVLVWSLFPGRFGWITDPAGNRIELWQPPPGRQRTRAGLSS